MAYLDKFCISFQTFWVLISMMLAPAGMKDAQNPK